jgi:transposase
MEHSITPLSMEAVLYSYRTGMPWRDLPERFGDGVQVHRRFSRWAKSGVWARVFQYLAADADNEYAMRFGYRPIDVRLDTARVRPAVVVGSGSAPQTEKRPLVRLQAPEHPATD